ncbi:peamaclein-like [Hordeum vulgare subsp. vulgare]|uniref:Uncharacterized protein n=1 Tax=Hordeum vulgare subsp. vulgare TaxID=112509 RepID=M0VWM7_HORVV|nr:peamaclein-like [Hordeum vulgare subsp. vulgare]UZF96588.1 snakin 5 [Hordeum vulgare]
MKKLRTTTTATTTLALLLLLVLLAASTLRVAMAGSALCDGKCGVRCSKASRHDDCLKYCGICCAECNCVPSGTAGNKDECPCYRDKTTGHGARKRPKCP